MKPLKVL